MNRQSRALLFILIVAGVLGIGYYLRTAVAPPAAPLALDEGPAAPAVRGGTLVASLRAEPRSFNRLTSRDYATEIVAMLTQGRLVRVNRATEEVEPWLAESWTVSPDGLTYTLTLREGVRWSDGAPFTSDDVVFTLAAVDDPRNASVLATSMRIDGAPLAVTAPDPRTVVVTFPTPFGPGIRLLDNLTIAPRHLLGDAAAAGTLAEAWTASTPPGEMAGLGPFMLVRYEPGQRLVFDRNPRYWRTDGRGEALPYLDRLVLDIVPDQNAELLRLESGQIDMVQQHLRPEDLSAARTLATAGRLRLLELGVGLDPDAFFFNLRPAKWASDPRAAWMPRAEFRHAISHAVDREAFANTVFLGAAVPVHGPITPGNKTWFSPNVPRYGYDQARARALLEGLGLTLNAATGFAEDAAGTRARFSVLTYSGNTQLMRGAEVLREDLRAIGVEMDIVPLEPNALIQRMLSGDFDAIYFNYFATDTDPAMSKDFWLSSGSAHVWHIGQATPATDWERTIDDLMTRQAASLDHEERVRLFNDVQRIFAEQLPVIYFAAPRLFIGVSSRVTHYTAGPIRPQLLWSPDSLAVAPAATP
ncbi:MAG: ABC transporter substrate-binding protein [Vicinamibacterales bacterium]|nr:ABC transporter substrate-binding protein [Vicinamibacterales bacterium]